MFEKIVGYFHSKASLENYKIVIQQGYCSVWRSSCGRVESVMDLHTTGPGFKTWWVLYTFYRASDDYHHNSIMKLSFPWYVEGHGRISRFGLTHDEWVVVYSSVTFHIIGYNDSVCKQWSVGVSCPVSVAWHSCVTAHWSKYHCYKQAQSQYNLGC